MWLHAEGHMLANQANQPFLWKALLLRALAAPLSLNNFCTVLSLSLQGEGVRAELFTWMHSAGSEH